jgi:DnaD/phage-associated family protein
MAKVLSVLESDVINAWRHWESEGLVNVSGSWESPSLEFLAPKPKTQAQAALPDMEQASKRRQTTEKPVYDPEELEVYQTRCPEVKVLFKKAERIFGTLLDNKALGVIFSLHDWLNLPVEVVDYLLSYCLERDIKSLSYIEKVGMNWADEGIGSVEEAVSHVLRYDGEYKEILKAMGLKFNSPSSSQKRIMDTWLHEQGMPLSVILEAIDRAVYTRNEATFAYVSGILKKWDESGIKTVEAAKAEYEAHQAAAKKPKACAKSSRSRFVNFTQRANDYKLLEQLEYERQKESVKDSVSV